jgi:hypothetical protein
MIPKAASVTSFSISVEIPTSSRPASEIKIADVEGGHVFYLLRSHVYRTGNA